MAKNETIQQKIQEELEIIERKVGFLESLQPQVQQFASFYQNPAREQYNSLLLNSFGVIEGHVKEFKKMNYEIEDYKDDFDEVRILHILSS